MTETRILIVDDSLEMRDFMADVVLSDEEATIDRARNGAEGLQMALEVNPDLIVTDLAMPVMTGLEMLEELRRQGKMMPAILMTAEGSEDIAIRALRAGVMDYFVKPFEPSDLHEAIQRVLSASRIGSLRTGVPDQRRLQTLNTLIAVGKSITSLLDLDEILARVVEASVFLSQAEEGTLMLVDAESNELYIRASKNVEEGLRTARFKVEDSLAGRVMQSGKPLVISGEGPQKIKSQYLVRSLVYVPLRVGEQVIGILGVHNRTSDGDVSPQVVGSLTALADYAAIAIANARAYQNVEAERTKLDRILTGIQDGVMLLDDDDRVQMANPVAQSIMTLGNDGAYLGKPIGEVMSNRLLIDLLDYSKFDTGTASGEVEDGPHIFNTHISPIEGVGRVIVLQNITNLKELDRIKSELVQVVSHDLRSPLTGILSYIALMGRVGELNEEQKQFTEQARSNVEEITTLINDLLDVGKIEAGLDTQRERVDFVALARAVVESHKQKATLKEQNLHFNASDDVSPILGNPARLRQIVGNLVDNAIKYTPEGGQIITRVFHEAESVMLSVADTGMGIPVEDQERIFEKFYRVKAIEESHVGSGLGLNIVQSIVEAHGGRVWVESTPGMGTIFTVLFPAYEENGA